MRMLFLLVPAVLAGSLAAQTKYLVSPLFCATGEGQAGSYDPFGWYPATRRYQQQHRGLNPGTLQVIGMAWRRDGDTTASYPAISLEIRVDFSSVKVATPFTREFDINHGADRMTVVHGQGGPASYLKVNWPATTHSTVPGPFGYQLPFTKPFRLTHPVLVWDAVIRNLTVGTNPTPFDLATHNSGISNNSWGGVPDPNTARSVLSTTPMCVASGHLDPANSAVTGQLQGGWWSVTLHCNRLPRSSPVFWFLGHRNDRWGSATLPLVLPGTTCGLFTPPMLIGTPVASDIVGNATGSIRFKNDPAYGDMRLWIQWAGLDPGKPQGLMLSRATTLYFPNKQGFPPTLSDRVDALSGLVTRFTVR